MKRKYPLVMIDSRKDENYPHDFITVLDDECGFVARIVPYFDEELYRQSLEIAKKKDDFRNWFDQKDFRKGGGLILEVLEFTNKEIEFTSKATQRIRSLFKRAMKKYVFGVVQDSLNPENEFGIDNQITQQKLTIARAKANYSDLLRRTEGDRMHADFVIGIAEATLRTLEDYKRLNEDDL